jgi:hypothetical protein
MHVVWGLLEKDPMDRMPLLEARWLLRATTERPPGEWAVSAMPSAPPARSTAWYELTHTAEHVERVGDGLLIWHSRGAWLMVKALLHDTGAPYYSEWKGEAIQSPGEAGRDMKHLHCTLT